jgi:hypothetical protein
LATAERMRVRRSLGGNVNLEDSLKDSVLVAEFASFIGEEACKSEHDHTFRWYQSRLESIKDSDCSSWDAPTARRVFKIILALSLLIACRPSADEQRVYLEQTFFKLLGNGRPHDYITNFILCELSYLDQFLRKYELRAFVYEKIKNLLDVFPNSSSFVDYDLGWRLLSSIRENVLVEESTEIPSKGSADQAFQVILVSSVKGGVGKSTVAIALAQRLTDDAHAKVALIDLDASGPTLQYNLHVPAVATGLSLKPRRSGGEPKWPYPTFADVIVNVTDEEATDTSLDSLILPVSGHKLPNSNRLAAVLIPDSPTVTGVEVTARYFNSLQWPAILIPLGRLIDRIKKQGCKYVILDLGPGLFGTNGALFSSLMEKYHTSMILMSSPRSFDIASALYEGFWLGAETSLPWQRQILQLLNFWPREDGNIDDSFCQLIDQYYMMMFNHDFGLSECSPTSGQYILFWRLRSYLYKLAVSKCRLSPIIMKPLHYDESLRELLRNSEVGSVDFEKLRNSKWYKNDFVPIIDEWLKKS